MDSMQMNVSGITFEDCKPVRRLYQETGHIRQISAETKERVRVESIQIAHKTKQKILGTRNKIETDILSKIIKYEKQNVHRIQNYVERTMASPLKKSQYNLEEQRMVRHSKKLAEDRLELNKERRLNTLSRNGLPYKKTILFDDVLQQANNPADYNAIEARRLKLLSQQNRRQFDLLSDLVHEEVNELPSKFPFSTC